MGITEKYRNLQLANKYIVGKNVELNKAIYVNKCLRSEMPTSLANLLHSDSNGRYSLPSEHKLSTPKARIELFRKSSAYTGAKGWNTSPADAKTSETMGSV